MKIVMSLVFAVLGLGLGSAGAVSYPLANGILTDSAGTAETVPYRDSRGESAQGIMVLTPTVIGSHSENNEIGIYTSTIVPFTTSYQLLVASGNANMFMTSVPNISTTTSVQAAGAVGTELTNGTYLVLSTTASAVITFQDDGTLAGSQLKLGSGTRAIGAGDILCLLYDTALHAWKETCFVNN